MKQNLLAIYLLILVAGCGEREFLSVPMQSSPLSFLDLSVQGLKGAYAQDPYAESVRSADGKTTNLFSICNTSDTGRRPLALDCPSGHSEARQRRANQLILHNTLESLIDTVHVFRHQRFFFRNESRNVSIHYVIGRDGSVIKMVPENRVAHHAGNANAASIGIELVANIAGNPDRGHDKPRTWDPAANRPVLFDAGGITIAQYYSLLGKIADIMADKSNDIDTFADVSAHRHVNSGTKCPSAVWWPAGNSFEQWRERSLPQHLRCYQQNEGSIKDFMGCIGAN